MTEAQEKLFKENEFIKSIIGGKDYFNVTLCGGAVLDILEGRKPKDYDFLSFSLSKYTESLGLVYMHDSKTATTYKKGKHTVQVLKTSKEDFDYTISQATLSIDNSGKMVLKMDENSFNSKILVPTDRAWENKRNALNCLQRVIHWRAKGYNLPDMTYLSLLGICTKDSVKDPYSFNS